MVRGGPSPRRTCARGLTLVPSRRGEGPPDWWWVKCPVSTCTNGRCVMALVEARPLAVRGETSPWVVALDVTAKVVLLLLMVRVALDPAWGNLEGKSPGTRAVTYPLLSLVVPAVFFLRAPPPWRLPLGGRPTGDRPRVLRRPGQPAGPLRPVVLVRRLDALHEHRAPVRCGPPPQRGFPELPSGAGSSWPSRPA